MRLRIRLVGCMFWATIHATPPRSRVPTPKAKHRQDTTRGNRDEIHHQTGDVLLMVTVGDLSWAGCPMRSHRCMWASFAGPPPLPLLLLHLYLLPFIIPFPVLYLFFLYLYFFHGLLLSCKNISDGVQIVEERYSQILNIGNLGSSCIVLPNVGFWKDFIIF